MRKFTLTLVATFLMVTTAHAGIIYSGNFFAPGPISVIPSISGDWSFTFDQTQATSGDQIFSDLSLDTMIFSPDPLGSTTFNASNTYASLSFADGTLDTLSLYSAGLDLTDFTQDSFLISYLANGDVNASWKTPSFSVGGTRDASGNFETSEALAVPEPTSIWLIVAGLAGLGFAQRRRT